MIRFDNKTDIKSLEQSYKALSENNATDIIISKSLSAVDFGLIPAIIQFISTWFRKCPEGKIVFNLKNEKELPEFYDLDYLFPSIVYCWSKEMIDLNGRDLKPFLKEQNQISHEKMRMQKEGGGPKVMLSCFDHLSVKNGLLNVFYTDGIFISSELEFDFAIQKSIRQIVSLNRSLRTSNIAPIYDDIIAIIYELMKNTDDWARIDENNKPLSPNTRGVFLKLHRRKREGFSTGFENFAGLKNYFSVDNFEANTQDELYFMEISVYDTGIGFVKRNISDDAIIPQAAKQVEIIRNCLVKNNTTATGIAKTIKGLGLDRIMQILDNKGLFWLRTQNVSIFRNLRENRFQENMTSADIKLYDLFNNSNASFSALAEAQGSVVTLVYPFSNISNA